MLPLLALVAVFYLVLFRPEQKRRREHEPIRLGLDLQGGTHLLYGVEVDQAIDNTVDRQMQELERVLREEQIGAASVERKGRTIHLQLANKDKRAQVEALVKDRFANLVAVPEADTEASDLAYTLEPREVQRLRDNVQQEGVSEGMVVRFVRDARGTQEVGEITSASVGRQLAIVLDGVVESAPVIEDPITGGRGLIRGHFDFTEAQDLANVLRNGALPAPLKLIEERTVGPSLGQDSIRRGVLSFVVGSALVILFMLVYYRGGGAIADGALLLNVLLLVGAFAAFGFTLSLPGIAGIVLTIGMAVDANVLILERIREELRLGKTPRAAIEAGYERAWYAIRDSNVTTFCSGLILFQFGSGPVRGFAVTLCLGILTILATGVFGTRVVDDFIP